MSFPSRAPRTPLVPPNGMDLHVRDMTATFAAGVTLAAAQTALETHQQWLPIDGPPDRPLGELIEQNSTGPLRLGYGAWRDLLLGAQFTNGQGELITAGGRTVKNVAGYDLTKLMVGQHGQLGKIQTLTVRTYRRPTVATIATFAPDLDFVKNLLPTPLKPQWMLLDATSLTCGYLGDETALAFYRAKLTALKPQLMLNRSVAADIADRADRWTGQARISVPPARVLDFVATAHLPQWIADPVFGIVLAPAIDTAALRDAAKAVGGSVVHPAEPPAVPVIARLQAVFGGASS